MTLIYFRATDLGFDEDGKKSPQLSGVTMHQSIKMHPKIGGLPAWTAVVDDETLAKVKKATGFVGVGINGAIEKYPLTAKYLKYVTYELKGETFTLTEDKNIPQDAIKVLTGFARHTFAGYDPMTGEQN